MPYRLIIAALLLCAPAFAEARYTVTHQATLSNAAGVVTIQQPASGAYNVAIEYIYLSCSVTCNYTVERDGTAATATSATPVPMTSDAPAAQALVFTASNVGTGSVLAPGTVSAGNFVTLEGDGMNMSYTRGTATNYTIRTNAISGDVKVVFKWKESKP